MLNKDKIKAVLDKMGYEFETDSANPGLVIGENIYNFEDVELMNYFHPVENNIYVVTRCFDYENFAVLKAFTLENDAKKFVDECFNSELEGWFEYIKIRLEAGNEKCP